MIPGLAPRVLYHVGMSKDDLKIQQALGALTRIQNDLTAAENRVEELRQQREVEMLAAKKLGAKNVQMARAINKTDQFVYWVMKKNKKAD